jgi:O-antigen biosynthesis protein
MQSDLLDDYVRGIGPTLRTALPATAIRHRSMDARRLMAHAALGGSGTLEDLLTAARKGDRRWLARTKRRKHAGLFAGLAQIIALQDLLPSDQRDALALYELVRATYGPDALSPANQALHAQLTLAWDGPERVPDLLAGYRRMSAAARAGLNVDLQNPFVAARPPEPWLAAFQALLPKPWPTLGGNVNLAAFDRLTSPVPADRVEAPERVSVVVTAYRPGEGLITAVRSILAQSWRNVEVVIVDDGSPAEFDGVLQRALALGERIRLVRQLQNRGTYAARNAGLDASGGEFVAFQDSDDWSHPRRLELQVAPMLAEKRLVATTSDGLSVTEELLLTRPGVRSGRFNPSSLVFRRATVTTRIGYFDPVRKAADSEYIGRMQATFGARSVRHVETGPLALIRLSANSLSRAEIRAHWMHPARVAYSSAYLRWHQAIAAGEARPYRPADGGDRPFAAPPHLLGGAGPTRAYDVVMVGDWRFQDGPVRAAIDEIRALADAGLRVAVAQLESYRAVYRLRYPMCGPIQQLVNDRRIDHVGLGAAVDTELVVVRQAEVLQFAAEPPPAPEPAAGTEEQIGDGPSPIRPRRVIVVADRAPGRRYAPATCAARARQLYGVEPLWCPSDPVVRSALRAADPAAPLTREDLPAVVDSSGWVSTRTGTTPGLPIVGADLCDGDTPPPDLRDADIRVRLADRPASDVEHQLPGSWLVYQPAEIGARPFLHQLDFYLHVPRQGAAGTLSRAALEAAAAGCVVVLPEPYAAGYGDAAVYTEPAGVPELIHRYVADPELYAEQSRRARAVVAKAHHPRLFVDRMVALIGPVTPPAPRNGGPGAAVTDVWPSGDLATETAR